MLRYLRLYCHFLRFSFSKALLFRIDFAFRIVMDCVFYAVQIGFFAVIYQHTRSLAGLRYDQALVFVCGFLFVDALHMTVFSNNMWMFPFLVNRGDLDYYLIRPVSSLFFVSLREFAANSFVNLVIAGLLLGWALSNYEEPLTVGSILLFVVFLILGTVVFWLLHLLALIPVFWLHSAEGLRSLFFGLSRFGERPHQIYPNWGQRLLTTALPLALFASYPSSLLFSGFTVSSMALFGGVLLGLALVVRWTWARALRAYASASS